MQTVTTASAAAGAVSAQQAGRSVSSEPAKIAVVPVENAAEAALQFFSEAQFATLQSLSVLLQPSLNGKPGAAEAGAAAFLDFHVGVSPRPRQDLYRSGLDYVDAESRRLFAKPFPGLTEAEAEKVLRPLLAAWTYDGPSDYRQRFLTELRSDVRAATMNSKEMSQVPNASRRRRGGGSAPYWLPIDPTR